MALAGASTTGATLAVKIVTDASEAAKGMDDASGQVSRWQSGLNRATAAATIAAAGVIAFGRATFDAASQAEQAGGAVDAVFKGNAAQIHDFARSAAGDLGLSSRSYEEMASVFGAQLKNMGMAADDLVPTTDSLIGMGADLAAQFGGSTSDAVAALSSLLRGERDPIERYGVSIKQADIEARKAAMGLDGLTGEADKAATTQATLALLTEQTADAQGAFAREADTAAGQQARANAAWEDAKASLGRVLLPLVSKASRLLAGLARFVGRNAVVFQVLAGAIVGVAGVLLAIKAATAAWNAVQLIAKAATMAWQAAQWLLNAALSANPIGLVVVAVAALVAAIILAWKNSETFRDIVRKAADIAVAAFKAVWAAVKTVWNIIMGVFNWVRTNWPLLLAILTGPIGIAVAAIIRHWDSVIAIIRRLIDTIRNALVGAWNWVRDRATSVLGTIRDAIQWPIDKLDALWGWLSDNIPTAFGNAYSAATWVLGLIRDAIQWPIDKVRSLIDWIGRIRFPSPPGWMRSVGNAILPGNPFGRTMVASAPAARTRFGVAAPELGRNITRRGGALFGGGGDTIMVNVTGALDPDAVARQIERILTQRQRRVSGIAVRGAA